MRSVAPESAGSAASQKSWFGVNLKPSALRFTATTLQSCQTTNARKRHGTEIQRLMRAMASPSRSQNFLSSGVQMVMSFPGRAGSSVAGVVEWVDLEAPLFGDPCREARAADLGAPHFGEIHPGERHPHDAVHQHEAARADAGEVDERAEHDRQQESAEPAGETDDPRDHADVV